MKQRISLLMMLSLLVLPFVACKNDTSKQPKQGQQSSLDYRQVAIPDFNADSAYRFVADQLSFGFRHPGTKGHAQCADYLAASLRRFCDTVIVQTFSTTLWDGQTVEGRNIIGSLAPERDKRVLLAAHWDSRQWADHDLDTNNWRKPLLGANDGASGVGLLLEMARCMAALPPDVGVDFVFFDVEDQGIAEWAGRYEDNTWCKGSQYWSSNPHRMFYTAQYGILFDMVGTAKPRFTKEEISMSFAQGVMNKMWACAASIGYGNVFVDELSGSILDDHLYVNQILRIPTIDVVQNSPECSFYEHWHTVGDDLDAVSKETLLTVATVALKLLYGDFPNAKQS
jgi:hypothetical protein